MGKIEKTDRAAKTIESWWSLLFTEGSLGRTAFQWVWPVIGGAIGAWVASATSWIGSYGVAGWAATIAVGALMAIWAMVGLETLRLRRAHRLNGIEDGGLSEDAVTALIEARLPSLDALAKHSDIHERDVKLAELSDRINFVRRMAESADALIQQEANERADLRQKLDLWTHQHSRSNDQRFGWVDQGFKAILQREQLHELFAEIETYAPRLLGPAEGKSVDNWGAWGQQKAKCLGLIEQWCEIADQFCFDTSKKVLEITPQQLNASWTERDSLFPNGDAMIAYRTIAATIMNLRDERDRVEETVKSWAYNSPSKKGRGDLTDEGQ